MPVGDARELIEADVEATCAAITAAAYGMTEDFRLVSRDVVMWDQVSNLYPALLVKVESAQSTFIELGWTTETRLTFLVIVYFKPMAHEVPATTANAYRRAIERAVMQAPHRGGYADWTQLDDAPEPYIWKDTQTGPVLEVTTRFTVIYTYDPREAAVNP